MNTDKPGSPRRAGRNQGIHHRATENTEKRVWFSLCSLWLCGENLLLKKQGFAGPPNPEPYGFRREVIPVHDLKVRLNRDVQRVLLVPGEQELPVRRSGGAAEVVVPKLEMHSMLVVE